MIFIKLLILFIICYQCIFSKNSLELPLDISVKVIALNKCISNKIDKNIFQVNLYNKENYELFYLVKTDSDVKLIKISKQSKQTIKIYSKKNLYPKVYLLSSKSKKIINTYSDFLLNNK